MNKHNKKNNPLSKGFRWPFFDRRGAKNQHSDDSFSDDSFSDGSFSDGSFSDDSVDVPRREESIRADKILDPKQLQVPYGSTKNHEHRDDYGGSTLPHITMDLSSPIIAGVPGPELEPKPNDPQYHVPNIYTPDVIADCWTSPLGTILGACIRGKVHRFYGTPRQDNMNISMSRDGKKLFIAIADGVSAAKLSHYGSWLVTRYAMDYLLEKYVHPSSFDWNKLLKYLNSQLAESTIKICGTATADFDIALKEFATTFVCVALEKEHNHIAGQAIAVGDSGIRILSDNKFKSIIGGKNVQSSGFVSSAVKPMPTGEMVTPVSFTLNDHDVLLVGSDGWTDPLGQGDGPLGQVYKNFFAAEKNISPVEFIHTLDFSKNTFDDDRTLVAFIAGASAAQVGNIPGGAKPANTYQYYVPKLYFPDTIADRWTCSLGTVTAGCVRSNAHRQRAVPRQDSMQVDISKDGHKVYIVLADGQTDARFSHYAAKISATVALEYLRSKNSNGSNIDWNDLVRDVNAQLLREAPRVVGLDALDQHQIERELATALSCVILEKDETGIFGSAITMGATGFYSLNGAEFIPLVPQELQDPLRIGYRQTLPMAHLKDQFVSFTFEIFPDETLLIGSAGWYHPFISGNSSLAGIFRKLFSGAKPPTTMQFIHALDFSVDSAASADLDRTVIAVNPRH